MLAAATAATVLLLLSMLLIALALLEMLLLLLTAAAAGVHAVVCCWLAGMPGHQASLPLARSDRLQQIYMGYRQWALASGCCFYSAVGLALLC
jgi:hypothetical protein